MWPVEPERRRQEGVLQDRCQHQWWDAEIQGHARSLGPVARPSAPVLILALNKQVAVQEVGPPFPYLKQGFLEKSHYFNDVMVLREGQS